MSPRPPGQPIGVRVSATAKLLDRAFDDALAAVGGSRPQWLILMALKNHPGANQRELAEVVGIRGATLTHHLNALEDGGLLSRRRDPANRRVHVVELSAAGEAAFTRMLGTVVDFDRRLRTGLTRTQITQLDQLLAQLEANVAEA
jgi:MarR family transcriptional regulator for hemolysin